MPMDDGLQFANIQKVERTQPMWVVAAYSKRGELIVPVPAFAFDRDTAQTWMESAMSEPGPSHDYHIRVLLPEHEYRTDAITEEEYAAMQPAYEQGTPVQMVNAQYVTMGRVTRTDAHYVYARLAKGGPEYCYRPESLAPVSEEEYAQHLQYWQEREQTQQAVTPKQTPVEATRKPTFRYVCLECGTKHSKQQCPRCGSDESLLNTDADLDRTILSERANTEPQYPPEGE